MRLDKYLQVTGLIKRRALANEACKLGLVTVNGIKAKATKEIVINDVIQVDLAKRLIKIKVLKEVTGNSIKKSIRSEYFQTIEDSKKQFISDDDFWNDEDFDDE